MTHISPTIGQEISCVMKGVNKIYLSKYQPLTKLLQNFLKEEKFGILNTTAHQFEPQGFTILILLSESHLAVHTYPEHDALYFSLYSCRGPTDSQNTFEKLKNVINPKEIIFMSNNQVPLLADNKMLVSPYFKKRKPNKQSVG